jgi:hypothetical protein
MEKLLEEINELIEEEHGEPITADDTIMSSGVDSFGITMIIMAINDKYNLWDKKELGKVNYPNITPRDIQGLLDESK